MTTNLKSLAGSFAQNTATGNQSITGLGFQPKIIFFMANNKTADGAAVHCERLFGVAISSSDRRVSFGSFSDGGAANENCAHELDTACLTFLSPNSSTVLAQADFVSMDSDGFTVNWTTADATARVINFVALGGSGLTNVKSGHAAEKATTGNQAYTGIGFQPDCVLMFYNISNTIAPPRLTQGIAANPRGRLGWAVSSSQRGGFTDLLSFSGTSLMKTYQRSSSAYSRIQSAGASMSAEADLVSMDADGFTLNWTTASATAVFFYIALKGCQVSAGSFNQATSTGHQGLTGVGFKPIAVMMQSINQATSSSIQGSVRSSWGMASGPSNRCSLWKGAVDGGANNNCSQDLDRTKVLKMMTANGASPTTQAAADFVSFGQNGFTINNTTVDGTSREVLYLLFGVVPRQQSFNVNQAVNRASTF